jgi:hypothetical protein
VTHALAAVESVTRKYYPLLIGRPAPNFFGIHRSDEWKKFFAKE